MKRSILLLVCFIVSIGLAIAQSKPVSGTVIDENGEPVIGATVVAKGTSSIGSTTNIDGAFSFSVPESVTTLVIRFVGFANAEVPASTNQKITLRSDLKVLDEVVVTAFGLTRSGKSIGYATTTIKSEDLNVSLPVSVAGGLAGKVAGVNISQGGGTGTAQKVIVRGFSSFNSNNPLYVIDGVPIRNSYTGTSGTNNATDYGTTSGDINPEDVASVTVLKGASATALYGSSAANGVILITTKKGASDSKITLSYSGSIAASNVLRTPKFQNMFGEGWPYFDPMENGSWGPRLDGKDHVWGAPLTNGIYDPDNGVEQKKKFEFVKNNIRDFYDNGVEKTHNVSIGGGNKTSSFAASYSNVTSDGIIPGNSDTYSRNTFSFRGNTEYQKFKANFTVNYARKDINQVRGGQGSTASGGATTFQNLIQIPVDISLSRDLKDLSNPYNSPDNYFTPYAMNPYWIIQNNTNSYQDDHVYGKIELSLELLKGLTAIGRLGGDFMNYREYTKGGIYRPAPGSWNYGVKSPEPGYYGEHFEYLGQIDATALLDANYTLNADWRVTGVAGWNLNQTNLGNLDSYLAALNVPDWYSLDNGNTLATTTSRPNSPTRRVIGLLAQGDLSFRDWAFLGLSLRNDWSSTLPPQANSFFYWGVSGSVILTDAIASLKENSALSLLKIRAGYGKTGNDAPIYRTYSYFQPTKIGLGFGNLYLPLNNAAGLTEYNTIPNMSLRPEITTETEFGFDVRFFKNRLGLDFSWYNRDTKDQIISASVAPETGYTTRARNVGLINNHGIEAALNVTPVQTKDLSWNVGVSFTKNISEVKELWSNGNEPVTEYSLASAFDVSFKAIVGQPLGVFQVPKIRKENGKTVVNASGYPMVLSNEFETLGSSAPDFMLGFNTNITYKGFTFSALLDWHKGGLFYSNTARMLDWNGNGTNTLFNERQPFLVPNSVKLVSEATATNPAVYAENDVPLMTTGGVLSYWNYSSANKGMEGNAVLDKSYAKIRELALNYTLPGKWFAHTPVSKLELGVFGRNLFTWTARDNNYVDPETTNYGNDITSELGEFSAAPAVRTFGGTLKIVF